MEQEKKRLLDRHREYRNDLTLGIFGALLMNALRDYSVPSALLGLIVIISMYMLIRSIVVRD